MITSSDFFSKEFFTIDNQEIDQPIQTSEQVYTPWHQNFYDFKGRARQNSRYVKKNPPKSYSSLEHNQNKSFRKRVIQKQLLPIDKTIIIGTTDTKKKERKLLLPKKVEEIEIEKFPSINQKKVIPFTTRQEKKKKDKMKQQLYNILNKNPKKTFKKYTIKRKSFEQASPPFEIYRRCLIAARQYVDSYKKKQKIFF